MTPEDELLFRGVIDDLSYDERLEQGRGVSRDVRLTRSTPAEVVPAGFVRCDPPQRCRGDHTGTFKFVSKGGWCLECYTRARATKKYLNHVERMEGGEA